MYIHRVTVHSSGLGVRGWYSPNMHVFIPVHTEPSTRAVAVRNQGKGTCGVWLEVLFLVCREKHFPQGIRESLRAEQIHHFRRDGR